MGKVDRDIDAILDFCKEFRSKYLEEMEKAGRNLEMVASQIESEMHGTKFATKSQGELIAAARKIQQAVNQGEEHIRELERKMQDDKFRGEEFER